MHAEGFFVEAKGHAVTEALVADKLFATLDPTTRRVYVGEGATIALSDTVGFIRDLPHSLVESFKATLEETVQADLLLHVVDIANPRYREQIDAVNAVLEEIGADGVPQPQVLNQIDRVPGMVPEMIRDEIMEDDAVHIDVSHLSSVVQMTLELPPGDETIPLALDLCTYGKRLSPGYRGGGDPP